MSDLKVLVGKTVTGVYVSRGDDDVDAIKFTTNEGSIYTFNCYGDCCSRTWIEHVNGLQFLLGNPVRDVYDSDEVVDDADERDECVRVYQTFARTEKGEFSIEYRNGSNGYYGGSLEAGQGELNSGDEKITEDF